MFYAMPKTMIVFKFQSFAYFCTASVYRQKECNHLPRKSSFLESSSFTSAAVSGHVPRIPVPGRNPRRLEQRLPPPRRQQAPPSAGSAKAGAMALSGERDCTGVDAIDNLGI